MKIVVLWIIISIFYSFNDDEIDELLNSLGEEEVPIAPQTPPTKKIKISEESISLTTFLTTPLSKTKSKNVEVKQIFNYIILIL